jgi:SdrD B-like domain/Secretion system C-terminal sorting domain/Cohesin domain
VKEKLLIFYIVLTAFSISYAQITLSIRDTTLNQNSGSLVVPVYVSNFTDIGAISLVVKFDSTMLTLNGITNIPGHGTFLSSSNNKGKIIISWYDTSPLNIGNGILMNLDFNYNAGNSNLNFDEANCEITDTSASILNINYTNGVVKVLGSPATLAGNVWYDANHNGLKDTGEIGVQWVTANVYKSDGTWLNWVLTDQQGNYSFNNLTPGSYFVEFYLVDDNRAYTFTKPNIGKDSTINSCATALTDTTARTITVTLSSGETYSYLNAGLIDTSGITSIAENNRINSIPKKFSMVQNYPNPFNPSTVIQFSVPKLEKLTLSIYNILGQKVKTLFDEEISPGIHTVTFNAGNLSSGIYFYQLVGADINITKKMILTK